MLSTSPRRLSIGWRCIIGSNRIKEVFPAYTQRISVPFEYPVHFVNECFRADNSLLADVFNRLGENKRHRVAVFIDSGLCAKQSQIIPQLREYFHSHPTQLELAGAPELVPGGKSAKSGWGPVRDVMWMMGNLHLDRQSFVLGIGGGSALDMLGFASAIVHRGVRFVRMPTTTLSQADAGIGVKNGMDEHGMKNFVGTFAPPWAVINDFSFLSSLDEDDWIAGIAEAWKVAIIKDKAFFDWLSEHASALRERDLPSMEQAVYKTATLHLDHIAGGGDPFEFGSARPLDFGHWAGHKLETMSEYSLNHGQAVSIGIAVDSCCAFRAGLIDETQLNSIIAGLFSTGLPTWSQLLEQTDASGTLSILAGLEEFREHLGGRLTVTLPDGIGSRVEVHNIEESWIRWAIDHLRPPENSQ